MKNNVIHSMMKKKKVETKRDRNRRPHHQIQLTKPSSHEYPTFSLRQIQNKSQRFKSNKKL